MSDDRISQRDDNIALRQKQEQARVFRLAQRDHNLTLKAISLDSGIGYTTVQTYAKGEAVMSIASLFRLVGVIPDELLSLLLPEGRQIVQAPEEIDHDQLADSMVEYLAEKQRAHHPESECGPAIGPNEGKVLTRKFTVVAGSKAA